MHTTVEKLPKSQVKLTIELSVEDMKPFLERAAEDLSKEYKIEGFRPGKASLGIVIGRLGAQAVWEAAAGDAVRRTFVRAVQEHQLPTIGQPHIHVTKLAADNPFSFTAESAVLPEVVIGDDTSFKAKPTPVTVAPARVEEAIDELRQMFATEALVDRAAQHGDKVEIDIELSKDKVPVEGGSSKNHPVTIGSGHFIPGFEDQLVGVKKGEEKVFSLPFPKEYHNAALAGRHGEFKVNVKAVYQVTKPEVDDDFAKKAGQFENLQQLRTKLEENLRREAEEKEDAVFERALVDELIKRSKFGDLPEILVTTEIDKMLHELQEQVEQRGGKWPDYLTAVKKSVDDFKKEFRQPAEQRVKAALLIRAIAKRDRIEADPKQVEEEVQSTIKMYAHAPDLRQRIESEEYRDYLRSLQINRLVVAKLKSTATAAAT